MVFTEAQRLVLCTGWKTGYLSDSMNYGNFSEITGLSRKQISNWARAQIKNLGDEPIPQKSDTPLIFIINDLFRKKGLKRNRSAEDVETSIWPCIAPLLPEKKRRIRIRFTENQRNILQMAWQRGFLCDREHYGPISLITGLTRKQISNWARTRINKCNKDCLPPKNPAPIITIFKAMNEVIRSRPTCTTEHIPQGLQPAFYNAEKIKGDIDMRPPTFSQQHCRRSTSSNIGKCLSSQCISINSSRRAAEGKLNGYQLGRGVTKQFPANIVGPQPSRTSESFIICSRNSQRALEQVGLPTDLPINEFILHVALMGITRLSDEKVDVLAAVTCIQKDRLRYWLVNNGWEVVPAEQGICYERMKGPDYQTISSIPDDENISLLS